LAFHILGDLILKGKRLVGRMAFKRYIAF